MPLTEVKQKTNAVLLLLILILGLTAAFEAEYSHEMIYYAYFIVVPLTMYYLHKGTPGNSFSLPLHLPLFIFLILSALSLLWTINVNETLGELYKLVFYVILYYLTATYLQEKDIEKLIIAVLIIGTFIALLGILLFLLIKSQRIISVFNNPNPFGMYLAMLSLAGMGIYLHEYKNRWLAISLVVITSALVLTGSRGSLLAYGISFPLLFLFVSGNQLFDKLRQSLVVLVIVAISVFIISSAAPWIQNLEFNTGTLNKLVLRDSSLGSTSVVGRLSFWQVAWNIAMTHPFTGLGLGTYHLAYNSFRIDDKWWSMFTHNNYLQIWAETGVFALLAFIIFFLFFYISAIKETKIVREDGLYRGLLAACLAFLLHTFVDFTWNMPTVTIMFWVFLGSITALKSNDNNWILWNRKKNYHFAASLVIFLFLLGSGQQLAAYHFAVLGERTQMQENYQEAIKQYQLACRIFPYRAEYYSSISANYYTLYLKSKDKDQLDQSIYFLKKAIDLSPYDYKNYSFLGLMLWQQGRAGAEEYLKQAVKLGGFTPTPFSDLGHYYLSKGKLSEGEQIFLEGLEQSAFAYENAPGLSEKAKVIEKQVKMHLGLAMVYNEEKIYEREKEQLLKVLELDPENTVALKQIGKLQ
ncbi:MAG: O-antigen ligase family protein [Dehalobacterium sp.]